MITKQQAIEIAEATADLYEGGKAEMLAVVETLADAQAFPDADALAEIESVAGIVLDEQDRDGSYVDWKRRALRLATACRKAGLVKP